MKYGTAPPKVQLKTKRLAPMNLVQGYGIEDIKAANLKQIVYVILTTVIQSNQSRKNGRLGFRILVFSDFVRFRISGHGSGFRVLGF